MTSKGKYRSRDPYYPHGRQQLYDTYPVMDDMYYYPPHAAAPWSHYQHPPAYTHYPPHKNRVSSSSKKKHRRYHSPPPPAYHHYNHPQHRRHHSHSNRDNSHSHRHSSHHSSRSRSRSRSQSPTSPQTSYFVLKGSKNKFYELMLFPHKIKRKWGLLDNRSYQQATQEFKSRSQALEHYQKLQSRLLSKGYVQQDNHSRSPSYDHHDNYSVTNNSNNSNTSTGASGSPDLAKQAEVEFVQLAQQSRKSIVEWRNKFKSVGVTTPQAVTVAKEYFLQHVLGL